MATIYLRSTDGNDADDGSTWALAKATLAAALTAAGAGGTVYVADAHAETQASAMSLASPGTTASPVTVICVDDTGNPEPPTSVATTATVSTTGASNITFTGFAYCYGITFTAGNSTSAADLLFGAGSSFQWVMKSCGLTLGGNNASSDIMFGSGTVGITDSVVLEDCTLTFSNTSNRCLVRCRFTWHGGSIAGTIPTVLFGASGLSNGASTPITIRGVDLSAAASGKSLVNVASPRLIWIIENCKLGSSVSLTTGSVDARGGTEVHFVNCDSADTNYRYLSQTYNGTITHESTIVRTGGASDGTTPISRKMVTTANSKFYSPLISDPITVWLDTTGAYTGTVEVITDNVTLTDAEAWLEVEYLGTSGFPLSSFAHDRASNILSTPANQTTSTETWTTTGLTTPVKQALAVSFTTAEKGWARFRVYLAKASTTMYFDPEVNGLGFTSGRQWQGAAAYIIEGASGSGGAAGRRNMRGGFIN